MATGCRLTGGNHSLAKVPPMDSPRNLFPKSRTLLALLAAVMKQFTSPHQINQNLGKAGDFGQSARNDKEITRAKRSLTAAFGRVRPT